jgi:hypothetical protein
LCWGIRCVNWHDNVGCMMQLLLVWSSRPHSSTSGIFLLDIPMGCLPRLCRVRPLRTPKHTLRRMPPNRSWPLWKHTNAPTLRYCIEACRTLYCGRIFSARSSTHAIRTPSVRSTDGHHHTGASVRNGQPSVGLHRAVALRGLCLTRWGGLRRCPGTGTGGGQVTRRQKCALFFLSAPLRNYGARY